jgi:GNAT superfamily N-acetyltransferase
MSAAASFVLRPLAPTDTDVAKQLWTARFGGAPSTQQNWMAAALAPSHTALGLVAVAPQIDELVGVSFLDVGRRAYTRRYLGLNALDLAPSLADRNGIFHLSCVRADWEDQGIGSAFYERRLEALASRDVPRAFGTAWHRPAPVDSRVLFEKFDFTCLATIEQYYSRTGTRPTCPACSGACQCTASLYGRTVHQP